MGTCFLHAAYARDLRGGSSIEGQIARTRRRQQSPRDALRDNVKKVALDETLQAVSVAGLRPPRCGKGSSNCATSGSAQTLENLITLLLAESPALSRLHMVLEPTS